MPKAGASNNGFALFMQEYRKTLEKEKGRRFPDLSDVVPYAGEIWSQMSAAEKHEYKLRAKEFKSSDEYSRVRRESKFRPPRQPRPLTSSDVAKAAAAKTKKVVTSPDDSFTDEPTDVFLFDKRDEHKMFTRREEDRNSLKMALTWNACDSLEKLRKESFLVVSVQNYYEGPRYDFQPCELAVVQFSLLEGIKKCFHAILKPINVAPAFKQWALDNARSTHKILIDQPPPSAREDYSRVKEEVKSLYCYSQKDNQLRAFCLTKQFNSVQGACKTIRNKTGSRLFIPQEKISCVEDFLTILYSFQEKPVPREQYFGFGDLLRSNPYDLEPQTLCDFHKEHQSKFCALAIAKKTCYHLFECLQDLYQFHITPSHIPVLSGGMNYYAVVDPDFNEDDDDDEDEEKTLESLTGIVQKEPVVFRTARERRELAAAAAKAEAESKQNGHSSRRSKYNDYPESIPESFNRLPDFVEINSKLERVLEVNCREERASKTRSKVNGLAEIGRSVRAKNQQTQAVPPGIEKVKWETGPTYSVEHKRFVLPSEFAPKMQFDMNDHEKEEDEW